MTDQLYTNNAPVLQEAFEAGYRLECRIYETSPDWDDWAAPRSSLVENDLSCFCLKHDRDIRLAPNQDFKPKEVIDLYCDSAHARIDLTKEVE